MKKNENTFLLMILITYLQAVFFAVYAIGYVIYYFVKLRKEYEEFDIGMYLLMLMGLLCGIVASLLLAAISQTLTF